MLTRKSPFAQGENDRTIMQDGFSAPVESAPRQRFSSACAMVGRRVMDFSDNGDGTLTAVRCVDRQADDLDIQFEAGACPVVAIAPRAFEGCAALRRVILPESLRQIGEMAFSGCSHLRLLTIPGGVQRVGTLAFAKCSQLERVRIEPGVVQLGPSCFSKCAALKRVEMPASVTQMGGGAFFGCSKELRLYGAEDAPAAQYARLNGLTFDFQSWKDDEELVLREEEDGTLTVLGARQTAPHRIEIPTEICGRRVAAIAPKAFFASGTLEQLVVGGGVREIGESAFFGCRQLVSVSFERGLEQLKDSAFAGCESLTQVTLPWGTSAVGRMAFFGCTRLSFVKMPTTTRVSDFAFDGCAPGIRVFGGVYAGRMNPISE
ncbi:MAG: leucine-rich repeat domain-containing protein [Christensenellales bacterium]